MPNELLGTELIALCGAHSAALTSSERSYCEDYADPKALPSEERLLEIWQTIGRTSDRLPSIVGLLTLLTKRHWEACFAFEHPALRGDPLKQALLTVEQPPASFSCRSERWRALISSSPLFSLDQEEEQLLEPLARQVRIGKLYLRSAVGPEVALLARQTASEVALLHDAEQSLAREFLRLKADWSAAHAELGELALEVEQQRLANEHVRVAWMNEFGDAYLDQQAEEQRVRQLLRRRDLLRAKPDLSPEELDERVAALEAQEQSRLAELYADVQRCPAVHGMCYGTGEDAVDEERLAQYRQRLMEALVEIKRSLHPDKLTHHPRFALLSPAAKAGLAAIHQRWRSLMPSQLRFDRGQIGFELPSLTAVLGDLDRARTILEHAGIEVEVAALIQGETLAEKVDWLERELTILRGLIEEEHTRLLLLQEDAESLQRHADLSLSANWPDVRQSLTLKTQQLRARAGVLEREISALWEK